MNGASTPHKRTTSRPRSRTAQARFLIFASGFGRKWVLGVCRVLATNRGWWCAELEFDYLLADWGKGAWGLFSFLVGASDIGDV
ncbi:hypothetical protein NL676_011541 [Syzygium grande]|nr:hypothetical protein NL676_011541 [Syzygium grande]